MPSTINSDAAQTYRWKIPKNLMDYSVVSGIANNYLRDDSSMVPSSFISYCYLIFAINKYAEITSRLQEQRKIGSTLDQFWIT